MVEIKDQCNAKSMVKLFYGIYGEADVGSVEISRNAKVCKLQKAIYKRHNFFKNLSSCDELKLRVARKKNGVWLKNDRDLRELLRGGDVDFPEMRITWPIFDDKKGYFETNFEPGDGKEIHILVECPEYLIPLRGRTHMWQRTPANFWFPDEMRTFTVKGADGEDISHNVFEMVGFPPLIDYQMAYPVILERSCYRTIFNGLMEKTKEYLGTVDVNLVVDGNPGIGKSRFYLYCIFRLVHGLLDEDKTFGEYILVLNCGEKYHKYSWKEKVFTTVNKEEVARLQRVKNVVRLIEATSSELLSWMGVSILFSSPELQKVSKFKRITSWSFISPVWSLDELQVCNMFLDSRLKLTDDDLVSRYSEYGGIPRSVFSLNQQEKRDNVAAATDSFDPDILSFSKPVHAIHFNVVAMVPTTPETFETLYEFMFLSKVIADKIVMQEREDIVAQLAQALVPNVRYDFDETFRGQLYELFVHRWFAQSTKVKAKTISLRTLGKSSVPRPTPENGATSAKRKRSTELSGLKSKTRRINELAYTEGKCAGVNGDDENEMKVKNTRTHKTFTDNPDLLTIQTGFKYMWFDDLAEISPAERVTYYRSTSREFAVDALILEPTTKAETFAGVCYGLLMTINAKQPIDAKGVDKLVKWSTARNYSFVYVFVVPSALEADYMWQQIDSLSGEEHNRTRYLNDMVQLVAAVDPYIDIKPNRRKV